MSKECILGGGCFWCIESVYKHLDGVESVTSGYAGGGTDDPSYEMVCTGTTEHAEVVKIQYDENSITYRDILEVFFKVHSPETKNREGPDIGSQYRSVILYNSMEQKKIATEMIEELEESGKYSRIVTEVSELDEFYPAEERHQDYFEKNPSSAYCKMHIPEKISKVESEFDDLA